MCNIKLFASHVDASHRASTKKEAPNSKADKMTWRVDISQPISLPHMGTIMDSYLPSLIHYRRHQISNPLTTDLLQVPYVASFLKGINQPLSDGGEMLGFFHAEDWLTLLG